MSYIDDIINYMQQQKATAFIIPAGQNMVMQVGENNVPQRQTVSADQLTTIIRQTAPPAMQSLIGQTSNFEYPYQAASGTYIIRIRQDEGSPELTITSWAGDGAAAATQVKVTNAPPKNPKTDHLFNIPPDKVGTRKVEHIDELFRLLYETDSSDLHVKSNEHPVIRLHGTLYKLPEYEVFDNDTLKRVLYAITPKRNQDEWEETKDTDFAYEIENLARFRCNLNADRHGIGGVFRLIPSKVLTVDDLGLPPAMVRLCELSKGLVLVTGPTGSGKSTTLAALVDYCNRTRTDHIITIEDPIEFVHENKKCLVRQREVHVHTDSFKKALRAALREDPDIVLVGEMRDLETVAIAIETAETGHLVFGTLHTSSAASTVDRVIDQFPADQQDQIRVMLSESLKAVIAQTLFRKKGGGRIAAWEILLCPPSVANLIRERKTFQLNSMIQVNKGMGMITMNDAAIQLVRDGIVEPLEAYMKVIDKNGLMMQFEREGIPFQAPVQEEDSESSPKSG